MSRMTGCSADRVQHLARLNHLADCRQLAEAADRLIDDAVAARVTKRRADVRLRRQRPLRDGRGRCRGRRCRRPQPWPVLSFRTGRCPPTTAPTDDDHNDHDNHHDPPRDPSPFTGHELPGSSSVMNPVAPLVATDSPTTPLMAAITPFAGATSVVARRRAARIAAGLVHPSHRRGRWRVQSTSAVRCAPRPPPWSRRVAAAAVVTAHSA